MAIDHKQLLHKYAIRSHHNVIDFDKFSKQFDYVIEFDGGTSCNIPSKGYGIGYGSYHVFCGDNKIIEVSRQEFGSGHSCNSAEITTLSTALSSLVSYIREREDRLFKLQKERYIPDGLTVYPSILICGDSTIALKWARCVSDPSRNNKNQKFIDSIRSLRNMIESAQDSLFIGEIATYWRHRSKSVEMFGH
jgi:hypothetical protein